MVLPNYGMFLLSRFLVNIWLVRMTHDRDRMIYLGDRSGRGALCSSDGGGAQWMSSLVSIVT